MWDRKNIYLNYPESFQDRNHYGPFFSVIIAPFAILPDWLGLILWNLLMVMIFILGIKQLPFSEKKKSILGWLCLQDLLTSLVSFQFNTATAGLIILSYCYIYKNEEMKSAFAILIGTFVKLYGIVGFAFFFFIKNKKRFIFSIILISIIFLMLPTLIGGVSFSFHSYMDWYYNILEKNNSNQVLNSYQDISIMGFFRRVLNNAEISNLYFLIPAFILFFLTYLRKSEYKKLEFQLLFLASTLLFVVLFSSGSESSTYVIAVSGVMIWFLLKDTPKKLDYFLLLFVILFTSFAMSDLFPRYIKDHFIIKYSFKSVPCFFVWLKIIYELLTQKFEGKKIIN